MFTTYRVPPLPNPDTASRYVAPLTVLLSAIARRTRRLLAAALLARRRSGKFAQRLVSAV